MNHSFAEHLPWRVASLAGLLVGAISLAVGVGVWACLLRVGVAFLFFGIVGLIMRLALQQGTAPANLNDKHFDHTATEEADGSSIPPNAGDVKSDTLK